MKPIGDEHASDIASKDPPPWAKDVKEDEGDAMFDRRERLNNHIALLESAEMPSDALGRDQSLIRLAELKEELSEVEEEIAIARGDYLQGDPRRRPVSETPKEYGERLLARKEVLIAEGVRAWQKKMAAEENLSPSRIKQLLNAALKRRE